MQIEGPYSFKAVDGLKTPVYILKPGGEKKIIGEATVKVNDRMTFEVQLEEEYQDIETGSFEVPMRYTYLNLPDKSQINWRLNCLTRGPHDGRPDAIWNIALLHATNIFSVTQLEALVLTRIYTDAMQYVENSPFVQKGTGATTSVSKEWADKVRENASKSFLNVLKQKVGEITKYYDSPEWKRDIQSATKWVEENKLNPHYEPLHPHDSINMLCRIIGVGASIQASKEVG